MLAPTLGERLGHKHEVLKAVVHGHAVLVDDFETGGDPAAVLLPESQEERDRCKIYCGRITFIINYRIFSGKGSASTLPHQIGLDFFSPFLPCVVYLRLHKKLSFLNTSKNGEGRHGFQTLV